MHRSETCPEKASIRWAWRIREGGADIWVVGHSWFPMGPKRCSRWWYPFPSCDAISHRVSISETQNPVLAVSYNKGILSYIADTNEAYFWSYFLCDAAFASVLSSALWCFLGRPVMPICKLVTVCDSAEVTITISTHFLSVVSRYGAYTRLRIWSD